MAKVTYSLRLPKSLRDAVTAEVARRNANAINGSITATDWWIAAAREKLMKTVRSNRGRKRADTVGG